MLSNEGSTWVHSQKDPRLHFGESFTLSWLLFMDCGKKKKTLTRQYHVPVSNKNASDRYINLSEQSESL